MVVVVGIVVEGVVAITVVVVTQTCSPSPHDSGLPHHPVAPQASLLEANLCPARYASSALGCEFF